MNKKYKDKYYEYHHYVLSRSQIRNGVVKAKTSSFYLSFLLMRKSTYDLHFVREESVYEGLSLYFMSIREKVCVFHSHSQNIPITFQK